MYQVKRLVKDKRRTKKMKTYKAIRCVKSPNGFVHEWDYGFIKADNHTSALAWIIEKFGVGENGAYWSVKQVA
jgi:hypothetical protein